MTEQQLDELLKEKINHTHKTRFLRNAVMIALCVILLAAIGTLIYYVSTQAAARSSAKQPAQASPSSVSEDMPNLDDDTQPEDDPHTESDPQPGDTPQPESDTPQLGDDSELEGDAQPGNDAQPEGSLAPEGDARDSQSATITHQVQMVWFEGPIDTLPEKLDISVFYGDEEVITFALNADNDWTFTWEDTYPSNVLTLFGDFPREVSASVSISGDNFIIMGAVIAPITTHYQAHAAADVRESDDAVPSAYMVSDSGNIDGYGQEAELLPQTGQAWWPIGLLSALGCTAIVAGARAAAHFPFRRS